MQTPQNRAYSNQKRALTRALNSAPEHRERNVLAATRAALAEWQQWGAWPDDWARWQRALDDVYPFGQAPGLDDLAS
jgi:hypothetical protein